jgi:hypothetical protein
VGGVTHKRTQVPSFVIDAIFNLIIKINFLYYYNYYFDTKMREGGHGWHFPNAIYIFYYLF